MSLYFDCAVSGGGGAGNIHVSSTWHPHLPVLAVGSYSGNKIILYLVKQFLPNLVLSNLAKWRFTDCIWKLFLEPN